MTPGSGAIEDGAVRAESTRFEEGSLRAAAADGRYHVDKGMLELTGSKDRPATRSVQDERITVDAKTHRPDVRRPDAGREPSASVQQPARTSRDGAKPHAGPRHGSRRPPDRTVPAC